LSVATGVACTPGPKSTSSASAGQAGTLTGEPSGSSRPSPGTGAPTTRSGTWAAVNNDPQFIQVLYYQIGKGPGDNEVDTGRANPFYGES